MARGYEKTTGLVIQQGIFEESITAKHRVGTRMQLADGRVFYYAKAGGSGIIAGALLASVVTVSGHEDVDTSAQSAGDYEVTVTLNTTAVAENNLYAEGYLAMTESGTGVGQLVKIASHGMATTTGDLLLTLHDPIVTALTATGQADLMKNPFKDVILAATTSHMAAGIPLIPVTDNYYFWCQTFGPCCAQATTAIALGYNIVAGTDNGTVEEISTATTDIAQIAIPIIGHCIGTAGVDNKYTMIMLKLHP